MKNRKEYNKSYHKQYYLKNKERILNKNRIWDQRNRAKRVKITQRYVQKHKEKVKKYNEQFNQTVQGLFRTTIFGAKRRGYTFELTFEQFSKIVSNPCMYCGENKIKRGIDRLNNSIGYIAGNCVSACSICNFMKRTMSREDFLSKVKSIFIYNF